MSCFKSIFLKGGQCQKHGNYKEKRKWLVGNTVLVVCFFFFKSAQVEVQFRHPSERPGGDLWNWCRGEGYNLKMAFISQVSWNCKWKVGTGLAFSKIAGNPVQTRMLHLSCTFLLLSGHRVSLEHLKANKEIIWNGQDCPSVEHDLEIHLFSGRDT